MRAEGIETRHQVAALLRGNFSISKQDAATKRVLPAVVGMAFRLRPRLRRREAIGTVNAPQPVEGIFVAGIAAVRPDIRAVYRDKIGHLMLRLPGGGGTFRGMR